MRSFKIKTKTQKIGKIDPSQIGAKRTIECEFNDFVELFENAKKDSLEVNQSSRAPKIIKDSQGNFKKDKPTINLSFGKSGELIYPEGSILPLFLSQIISEVKSSHSLKSEVKGCTITIWPPNPKGKLIQCVIQPTSMSIVSRVIIAVGGKENFNFSLSNEALSHVEKVQSVEGNMLCFAGNSFNINLPTCSQLSINFDNNNFVVIPAKNKQSRDTKLTKDPNKRFVCVLDFSMNTDVVVDHIKSETLHHTQGRNLDENSNKMLSQFSHLLGIKDVSSTCHSEIDKIIQEIKDKKIKKEDNEDDDVEDIPILVPIEQKSLTSQITEIISELLPENNKNENLDVLKDLTVKLLKPSESKVPSSSSSSQSEIQLSSGY